MTTTWRKPKLKAFLEVCRFGPLWYYRLIVRGRAVAVSHSTLHPKQLRQWAQIDAPGLRLFHRRDERRPVTWVPF